MELNYSVMHYINSDRMELDFISQLIKILTELVDYILLVYRMVRLGIVDLLVLLII